MSLSSIRTVRLVGVLWWISCVVASGVSSQALPIKPARTIVFTTDVGTAMDVDLSPDGRTIIFNLLGDLYSIPDTGGRATQLTHGLAVNVRPVWSPDGKRIAYLGDASGRMSLMVRDRMGPFVRTLEPVHASWMDFSSGEWGDNNDPLWTPDGTSIVLDRAASGSVLVGLAGGRLALATMMAPRPVRFSADGHFVYGLDSGRLYRYDLAQHTKTAISPVLPPFQRGALSIDAHWWAYVADSSSGRCSHLASACLVVHDLVQNTERVLVPSLAVKYPDTRVLHQPRYAFAPDSKSLLIGYGGKIHRIDIETGNDRVIPFRAVVHVDCGRLVYHTFPQSLDSLHVRYTRSANMSPDGRHVVFAALGAVYVTDIGTATAHRLVRQPLTQFDPVYSPDGQWIVYASWGDSVTGALWKVRAIGGVPQQLTTEPGFYEDPAWTPDGTHIAALRGLPQEPRWGVGQLLLVAADSGPGRVLADSVPLEKNALSVSADGQRVFYRPPRTYSLGLEPKLVSVAVDGSTTRVVLSIRYAFGVPYDLTQTVVSPDGRWVAYVANDELYLAPLVPLQFPEVLFDSVSTPSVIRVATGVDPHWEQGGRQLSWSYGNHFYRIDPARIFAAATVQHQVPSAGLSRGVVTAHVEPEVVPLLVTAPRAFGHGTLALRDVRIITMQGSRVIAHGTVIIRNGRFAAVGPMASVRIPTGATRLDLPGTTIIPGLIDMHWHGGDPDPDQHSATLQALLAYGATTVRNPATTLESFGVQERLEAGLLQGPRLFTTGVTVSDSLGSLDDANTVVHQRAVVGGTVIKQYTQHTRLQREWTLLASDAAGLNMTNEGNADLLSHVMMLKDGSTGIEHNPEAWGDVYDDVTTLFCRTGTYFTPTLQVRSGWELAQSTYNARYWLSQRAKLERWAPTVAATIREDTLLDTNHTWLSYAGAIDAAIRHCGGRLMVGSHGNEIGVGPQDEMWALQRGGLSNLEALQAATIVGAEGLGMQRDLGSIEVGKIADLIVLTANPLEDIHNSKDIRYVMKNGVLYDGDSLSIVWPKATPTVALH